MENTSIIGIKTADGAFYPILETDYEGKKKLVLTTVRDNQETVQIDLYQKKGEDDSRQYVGSLVIENIQEAPKGEPEIEVIIGIDTDGNLNAVANDRATGNKQRLTTSLENLNEDQLFDVPDFDIDESEEMHESKTDVTMMREPEDDFTIAEENEEKEDEPAPKKKSNPLLIILIILLGLAAVAGLTFLIFYLINQNTNTNKPEIQDLVEQTDTQTDTVAAADETDKKKPAENLQSEEDTRQNITNNTETEPEVVDNSSENQDSETPDNTDQNTTAPAEVNDFEYIIKWGDTLWDLSATFYRDPLKYPVIANYEKNNISDPDFILANTKLYIPEK